MQTREQQRAQFDAFGFLVLPGLLKADIDWITAEFAATFTDWDVKHDGTQRSTIVPFIDQRERMCTLLDHPAIVPVVENVLGSDFNYLGGDGNYYTGNTGWHSDGGHDVLRFIKVALYLDPVTRETGALRVIPGSHMLPAMSGWAARQAGRAHEQWGIGMQDVPSVALESQPGDVVVFNHNIMHSSFGGSSSRRMFTMNLCGHCDTQEQIDDLKGYISGHDRFWLDSMHGDIMKGTASPARMRHLVQVGQHEGHLPALSAKARERMSERSRG